MKMKSVKLIMERKEFERGLECPVCESRMIARRGAYGAFFGCENYPTCRGSIDGDTADRMFDRWKDNQAKPEFIKIEKPKTSPSIFTPPTPGKRRIG